MSTVNRKSQDYIQAAIEHIKFAQNGGALNARFRNGVTGDWTVGFLVGWTQGERPWVCGPYEDSDSTFEECETFQYCEVLI